MSEGKNWTVNSYTDDEWTTLVDSRAKLSAIIIANTGEGALDASIRLTDGAGNARATWLPPKSIAAGESVTLEMPGVFVGRQELLQVQGSGAGLHFTASGEEMQ